VQQLVERVGILEHVPDGPIVGDAGSDLRHVSAVGQLIVDTL
jgi:hypothetical protein